MRTLIFAVVLLLIAVTGVGAQERNGSEFRNTEAAWSEPGK